MNLLIVIEDEISIQWNYRIELSKYQFKIRALLLSVILSLKDETEQLNFKKLTNSPSQNIRLFILSFKKLKKLFIISSVYPTLAMEEWTHKQNFSL